MATHDTTKFYLDYLEKEMTIMGLLSTFCVVAVGLVLDKLLSAASGTLFSAIWSSGEAYVLTGSGFMLFAGLYFYRQRSHLAWFYGQICLSLSHSPATTEEWLEEVDSWEAWLYYHTAFVSMALAVFNYAEAIWAASSTGAGQWLRRHTASIIFTTALVTTCFTIARSQILKRHKFEDEPYKVFFKTLRKTL